jgi:NTP pyrophosphatase (non-canonical NTP hydrolase)
MDIETYSREALRTLPPEGRLHLEMVKPGQVFAALIAVVKACQTLDAVKKSYVYGRQLPAESPLHSATDVDFNSPMPIPDAVIHGTIGMATECGEIAEALIDAWFYGKHFDQKNAVEEAGDVLWYLNRYLSGVDSRIDVAMAANIAKLFARHKVTDATAHNFNADAYSEEGRDRLAEQIAADQAIAKVSVFGGGRQNRDNAVAVNSIFSTIPDRQPETPGISMLEHFDDDSQVWLESYAGGAHEHGLFGQVQLAFIGADGSRVMRTYTDDKLRGPLLGLATNAELERELAVRKELGHDAPDYKTAD